MNNPDSWSFLIGLTAVGGMSFGGFIAGAQDANAGYVWAVGFVAFLILVL